MKLIMGRKELEEKITCGMYSKRFATLTTHGNVSVKEEIMKGKIVYETCGKMFASQTLLKHNAVAHSKEHPCQCDMCHTNFKRSYEHSE
jgi:hypothetical protein